MKAGRTVSGAMVAAIAAGLIAGFATTLLLMLIARPWVAVGATLASLVAGFVTLLIRYPRWEADL